MFRHLRSKIMSTAVTIEFSNIFEHVTTRDLANFEGRFVRLSQYNFDLSIPNPNFVKRGNLELSKNIKLLFFSLIINCYLKF